MTFLKGAKKCTGKKEFKEASVRKAVIAVSTAHKKSSSTQFKVNPFTVEAAGKTTFMMQQSGEIGVVDLVAWSSP